MDVTEKTVTNWATPNEAAMHVRVVPRTIYRWLADGRLPPGIAHQPVPGGKWLIDLEALDRWVRNGCFTDTPGEGDAA